MRCAQNFLAFLATAQIVELEELVPKLLPHRIVLRTQLDIPQEGLELLEDPNISPASCMWLSPSPSPHTT